MNLAHKNFVSLRNIGLNPIAGSKQSSCFNQSNTPGNPIDPIGLLDLGPAIGIKYLIKFMYNKRGWGGGDGHTGASAESKND